MRLVCTTLDEYLRQLPMKITQDRENQVPKIQYTLAILPVRAAGEEHRFTSHMNAKDRSLRALAVCGVALSSLGLVGVLSAVTPSIADSSGGGGGSGTNQSLGVSVTSVEKCAYSLSGIASSLTLTASKTYNPDDNSLTSLSAADAGVSLSAYPGGNPSTPCSFYGNSSAGRVSVQVPTTPTWTGTSSSTTLSWTNTSDNKLNIAPNGGSDCTSAGATLSTLGLYTGNVTGTLVSITSSSSPKACTFGSTVTASIPKGLNAPQGTKVYSISGPTITYTLSLS
jgi:hypothetical protein